jgi:hypothetical protein
VFMQKSPAPSQVAGPADTPREPAVAAASAGDGMVKLVSDPEGASVTINGNPTGLVTPADIAVSDLQRARVQLLKTGFRQHVVRAGDTQIRSGVVQVRLDALGTAPPAPPAVPPAPAAPASLSVTFTGSYPFEVVDGSRVIGDSGTEHTLTVPGPRVLRLRNSDYMLDYAVRVDANRKVVSPPALGRLTIRTPLETCKVWLAGRDLGYPPITEQKLAANDYRVEVRCPDGDTRTENVTVEAGKLNTKVIR